MSGRNLVMLRLSAALLALTPALLVHAQQTPTTATLHGTVVNALTHQPIARALVSVDQDSQSRLTDNEGRFTFDDIPAGQITLSARRPGFSADDSGTNNTSRQNVTVGTADITLRLTGAYNTNSQSVAVSSTADITLQLTPLSAIAGQLLLPGDEPADTLQLQLLRQEIQNGRSHWSIYRNAEAASDGRFRFGNLPAGAYLVHVGASLDPVPALRPPGAGKPRSGYVPVFYPAAREIAAAGLIALSAGRQADIRMELTREPYYPVTIPVANYEDAGGVGFEVTSDSFLGIPARFSADDGLVHVDLPTGHYVLEARGFSARAPSGQREFDVNGGAARTAAITLLPKGRIPVTVHAELTHTNPSGFSPVGVPTPANQISLDLQRLGSGLSNRGQRPNLEDDAASASSGTSQLVGASPGKYWVNARAYAGYIAAMTSGGVDLLQNPLTVSADGSASAIEVSIRDDYATLALTLSSSLSVSAAPVYVHLLPQGSSSATDMTFHTQTTMQLNNIVPGSYLVLASRSQRQIEYRNPNVMAALAGKGQAVSVEPGGSASITIESLVDPLTETIGSAP